MREQRDRHNIHSDGVTVWVDGPDGSCIGRFGRNGIDIHTTAQVQATTGVSCLLCTHERVTAADWGRFVDGMREHHAVVVPAKFKPNALRTVKP